MDINIHFSFPAPVVPHTLHFSPLSLSSPLLRGPHPSSSCTVSLINHSAPAQLPLLLSLRGACSGASLAFPSLGSFSPTRPHPLKESVVPPQVLLCFAPYPCALSGTVSAIEPTWRVLCVDLWLHPLRQWRDLPKTNFLFGSRWAVIYTPLWTDTTENRHTQYMLVWFHTLFLPFLVIFSALLSRPLILPRVKVIYDQQSSSDACFPDSMGAKPSLTHFL